MLPYNDPTGVDGFYLLETENDARAFEVKLSDLEDRLQQRQKHMETGVHSGRSATRPEELRSDSHWNRSPTRSDTATVAPSSIAPNTESDESFVTDEEADLLAEHRVIILSGCNLDKVLDSLPSVIVRECELLCALHDS